MFAVESHPQKKHIIDSLLAGVPLRKVAATLDPPVHFASLQRYKLQHIRPAVANAQSIAKVLGKDKSITDDDLATVTAELATKAIHASPFRERLENLWQRTDKSIARAENAVRTVTDRETGELLAAGPDVAAIAPLLNQAHKNLEMLGQATGELANASTGSTTIIVVTHGGHASARPARPEPEVIDVVAER